MALQIHSTGLSAPDPHLDSVSHSAAAARACLEAAKMGVGDVDFLINVGVFRHHNMCEPSVCALIQHALEMSPDIRKYGGRAVFSFDLNNGACGLLNAVTVLGPMMRLRGKEFALVVGADCPPSGEPDPSFPITPMGSAMLLRLSSDSEPGGFGAARQRTTAEPFDGQTGSCDLSVHGARSRTTIDIVRAPDFLERLQAFARQTVGEFITEQGIERRGLRLVCSEPGRSFAADLATGLGLDDAAPLSTWDRYQDCHTSSVTVGMHEARRSGELNAGDRVLVVNAGGGLTVSSALYEMPASR